MNNIQTSNNYNKAMRILTGIAIILVVMGHADCNYLSVGGIFPYYSYHVMIFLFVSGYFYKPQSEDSVVAYIKKKTIHLLMPYFVWNLIYGVISTFLSGRGFIFCNPISFFNLLVEPFLGGHQYGLNFAAWFVPALFMIEVVNICGRKVLSVIARKCDQKIYDIVCLVISLMLGIVTVYLSMTGHVWGWYKTPGRILFMLPVFEFGCLFKSCLEKKMETIHWGDWLVIIFIAQLGLYLGSDGAMNFSAVWCTGFAVNPFMPYLTTLTGTMFVYTLSRILEKIQLGFIFERIGDASFNIMMHHMGVFFLLNTLIFSIGEISGNQKIDIAEFHENINYVYLAGGCGAFRLMYVILGIVIPILLYKFWGLIHIKKKSN